MLSETAAHAAVEARDSRFDGLFFTGVTSTGIYCRCICPARMPKRANRRYFPSAAAAEREGFRPCLICRPERAPGFAPIDRAERLAAEALRLIEAGALEERGVEGLARLLGVSDRHLRRATLETFGAAPIDLAQSHRLLTAKRLLRETSLPITDVAYASGFASLRRFNALFQERYGLTPSRVRAGAGKAKGAGGRLTLDLLSRGAFDPTMWLSFAQSRLVPGMERLEGPAYARTLRVGAHKGVLRLDLHSAGARVTVSEGLTPAVRTIVAAVRGALDLDADMMAIDAALDRAGCPAAGEGLRIAGGLDPFEIAVRAVLGQQVTLAFAGALTARLVEAVGEPLGEGAEPGLDRLFPTPGRIAEAGPERLGKLGMPRARAACLHGLAVAAAEGRLTLRRGAIAAGRETLAALPGVGPWTLEYVALRGLGDPDAFPVGDSALAQALGVKGRAMAERAAGFAPWRGYATMRLWAARMGAPLSGSRTPATSPVDGGGQSRSPG